MKTVNKEDYSEDIEFVLNFNCEDITVDLLKTQLSILASNIPALEVKYNLNDCISYSKRMSDGQRELYVRSNYSVITYSGYASNQCNQ